MVIGTSLVTATPYVAGRGVHPSAGTAARLTGTAATMASTPNTAINARLIGALPSPATRLVGSEVSPREPTVPGPPAPLTRVRSAALVAVGPGPAHCARELRRDRGRGWFGRSSRRGPGE